jgi:hypothetical protein
VPADPEAAKAALDRITIPADVLDRIAPMVSPRFSLIISDEALSDETSKGTEFVVVMSNEPQGGIKFRRHAPQSVARQEHLFGEHPFGEHPFGEHPFGDQHVSRPPLRSPFGNSW